MRVGKSNPTADFYCLKHVQVFAMRLIKKFPSPGTRRTTITSRPAGVVSAGIEGMDNYNFTNSMFCLWGLKIKNTMLSHPNSSQESSQFFGTPPGLLENGTYLYAYHFVKIGIAQFGQSNDSSTTCHENVRISSLILHL